MGAALARSGADVVLLMRPATRARYAGAVSVSSQVLGDFVVEVPAVSALDREVDVLWVTPKATHLAAALDLASAEVVADAQVIPLMNGVDHMSMLRSVYQTVTAGTLRVAAERGDGWLVRQPSPFLRVDLAGAPDVAAELHTAGIECHVHDDEVTLLWQKLAFLAPLALATTVARAPLGSVRHDARYLRAQLEVTSVAAAEGARLDLGALQLLRSAAPDTMRSSMQGDVERGRPPEVDAIAGPILRAGAQHGIDTSSTRKLADQVRTMAAAATGSAGSR